MGVLRMIYPCETASGARSPAPEAQYGNINCPHDRARRQRPIQLETTTAHEHEQRESVEKIRRRAWVLFQQNRSVLLLAAVGDAASGSSVIQRGAAFRRTEAAVSAI